MPPKKPKKTKLLKGNFDALFSKYQASKSHGELDTIIEEEIINKLKEKFYFQHTGRKKRFIENLDIDTFKLLYTNIDFIQNLYSPINTFKVNNIDLEIINQVIHLSLDDAVKLYASKRRKIDVNYNVKDTEVFDKKFLDKIIFILNNAEDSPEMNLNKNFQNYLGEANILGDIACLMQPLNKFSEELSDYIANDIESVINMNKFIKSIKDKTIIPTYPNKLSYVEVKLNALANDAKISIFEDKQDVINDTDLFSKKTKATNQSKKIVDVLFINFTKVELLIGEGKVEEAKDLIEEQINYIYDNRVKLEEAIGESSTLDDILNSLLRLYGELELTSEEPESQHIEKITYLKDKLSKVSSAEGDSSANSKPSILKSVVDAMKGLFGFSSNQ